MLCCTKERSNRTRNIKFDDDSKRATHNLRASISSRWAAKKKLNKWPLQPPKNKNRTWGLNSSVDDVTVLSPRNEAENNFYDCVCVSSDIIVFVFLF